MMLIRPPGVYRPQADTWLLARAMRDAAIPPGGRALDICTGTGALAVLAAQAGARAVTAVDISWSALVAAWFNSRIRGLGIELRLGDIVESIPDRRFDLVLANPPYVPTRDHRPARGAARAWNAGPDGRQLLDRLCAMLPRLLSESGIALLVHSALCRPELTLSQLRSGGVKAAIVARASIPLGPVLRGRAEQLTAAGLIRPGQRTEELVVVRADRIRK